MPPKGDSPPYAQHHETGTLLRQSIAAASGLPPRYVSKGPSIMQLDLERLRRSGLRAAEAGRKMAEAMVGISRVMRQLFAQLSENTRRAAALDAYRLGKLEAALDPQVDVQLVTTQREGCRVITRRLGGWAS